MDRLLEKLSRLVSELRRRRVFHVAVAYAVGAWIVVQVANVVVPALYLPRSALTLVVVLAVLCFPVAMVLTWAFDFTPEGLKRTPDAEIPSGELATGPAVRATLLGLVVLVTAGVGWVSWQRWLGPTASVAANAEPSEADLDPRRVAVLYFDDHSEEDRLGYLAAGLTEALIHELSQVGTLEVISRNGVKPYREGDVTPDSVARALRTGSLVEGSVQRSGDSLRVTAQLVDARTLTHLASRAITRPWGDLFELQEDLVEEVSALLRRRLGDQVRLRERRSETESSEALRLLWQAEEARKEAGELRSAGEREGAGRLLDRADSLLARAERLDPGWAGPAVLRAGLAADRVRPYSPAFDERDRTWIDSGLRQTERALEKDPGNADALERRGTLRYWLSRNVEDDDRSFRLLEAAEADLRRAVERDPSHARAWSRLSELLLEGKASFAEARLAAARAYEEDAYLDNASSILKQLCYTSQLVEEFEDAERWCRLGRERYSDHLGLIGSQLLLLATEGGVTPDVRQARRLVERTAELSRRQVPEDSAIFVSVTRMQLAAVYARAGHRDSARAILRDVYRTAPEDQERWLALEEANVRLILGEREEALRLLEEYLDANPQDRGRVAEDPWFRGLRDDPEFRRLVES